MADIRVARRYANALFAMAVKYDLVKSVEEDLAGVAGLLANDVQFRSFLISPEVGRTEKIDIAVKLFSDRVTALTMQAIRLCLTKGREHELGLIYEEYLELRRIKDGVLFVTVTSAEAMTKKQQEDLVSRLGKRTQRMIDPHFEIDPLLIGGVRVAYEGNVLDGSLKGYLKSLREHLCHDILTQF
jgi:F-type H+-transporting ATPase subunit delta